MLIESDSDNEKANGVLARPGSATEDQRNMSSDTPSISLSNLRQDGQNILCRLVRHGNPHSAYKTGRAEHCCVSLHTVQQATLGQGRFVHELLQADYSVAHESFHTVHTHRFLHWSEVWACSLTLRTSNAELDCSCPV